MSNDNDPTVGADAAGAERGAPDWEPSQVSAPGAGTAPEAPTRPLADQGSGAGAAETQPGGVAAPPRDDTLVMAGAPGAAAGAAATAGAGRAGLVPPDEVDDTPRGPSTAMIVLLVVALLLGAAGLGVGIYAAHKVAQPGHAGAQGNTGPTGATGPAGPKGAPGPAGQPGTVVSPTVVAGSVVSTSAAAAGGTTLTTSTSCPVGKVLLSGGAQVTASGATKDVALQSSYPANDTTWQTTAVVVTALPAGDVMTVKPYVLCGTEPTKTTTSTF